MLNDNMANSCRFPGLHSCHLQLNTRIDLTCPAYRRCARVHTTGPPPDVGSHPTRRCAHEHLTSGGGWWVLERTSQRTAQAEQLAQVTHRQGGIGKEHLGTIMEPSCS